MSTKKEREIMAAYCVGGNGLNIGCKDTQLGDSIGVDISAGAKAARVICDASRLPFPENKFDYIVALHSLEHFRISARFVVDEWCRVLKVGGVLAVNVPDCDYATLLTAEEVKLLDGRRWPWISNGHRDQHWQGFTKTTLEILFRAEGFDVIRSERIDRRPDRPEPTLLCVGRKVEWKRDSLLYPVVQFTYGNGNTQTGQQLGGATAAATKPSADTETR